MEGDQRRLLFLFARGDAGGFKAIGWAEGWAEG